MPYLKNSLKRGQPYIFRGCLHRRKDRYVMEQARIYKPEEYSEVKSARISAHTFCCAFVSR